MVWTQLTLPFLPPEDQSVLAVLSAKEREEIARAVAILLQAIIENHGVEGENDEDR